VRAPEEVGLGTAKARLSLDAWKEGKVGAADVELAVVEKAKRALRPVSPQLRMTLRVGGKDLVWSVGYSRDGALLSAATIDGQVKVWNARTTEEKTAVEVGPGRVWGAGLLPDGKTLVTAHWQATSRRARIDGKPVRLSEYRGGARLWDLTTGKRMRTFEHDPPRGVSRLAVSADGKSIATAESFSSNGGRDDHSSLSLWDVGTGKLRATLEITGGILAFAPDSRTLAGTGKAGVHLVDASAGKEAGTLAVEKESGTIASLVFSPDGRTLVGGSYQGELYFWDMAKRARLGLEHLGKMQRIMALAISPDSRTLAVAVQPMPPRPPRDPDDMEQPRLELWDVATRKKRATLVAPAGALVALAFSPDGKTLAAGTRGGVQLWDMTRR
jgi:WD40 repeat protein